MKQLYPLKFRNILKTVVWGGEKIAPFKGIGTGERNVGESWELSGVKGNESVVAEGPLAGHSISELVREYKGSLVGDKVYADSGDEFPLLIKFIDAESDLSIQVHPDDELAARRHQGMRGKSEMWYVVSADEDAYLIPGWDKKITPEEYAARVADKSITEVLRYRKVKAGDVFFLPAGRIHSIGGGCFIAEIQQASDITYRIYDFDRVGLDGKPRELHVELSKEAIDYSVSDDYRTHYEAAPNKETALVDCRNFSTSFYELDAPIDRDMEGLDSFMVLVCIGGSGSLRDDKGNEISLRQGETILLPADTKRFTLTPSPSLKVLSTCIK